MPGSRTHDVITLITVGIADGVYLAKVPHPTLGLMGLFTVAYLFAGYACAGDLDLMSREYKRWGPLRWIWKPYQILVPHRSWVSHGLIMGGLIRVLYLALVCTLLLWGGTWLVSQIGMQMDPNRVTWQEWSSLITLIQTHPHEAVALLSGFVLAGTTHSVADIIWSGIKRMF